MAENKALDSVVKDLGEFIGTAAGFDVAQIKPIVEYVSGNKEKVVALLKGGEAAVMETRPLPTQLQSYVDNHAWTAYPALGVKLMATGRAGVDAFGLIMRGINMARGVV